MHVFPSIMLPCRKNHVNLAVRRSVTISKMLSEGNMLCVPVMHSVRPIRRTVIQFKLFEDEMIVK